MWITSGGEAGAYLVFANVDQRAEQGDPQLLVERTFPAQVGKETEAEVRMRQIWRSR